MNGKQLLLIPLLFIGIVIGHAQPTSEFEGKVKITQLDADNSADSLVVKLPDGTLGLRGANSITSFQVLSISNDTIFLSNGGLIKLPAGFDGAFGSLTGVPADLADGDSVLTDANITALGYIKSPNDADKDSLNEIQDLSVAAGTGTTSVIDIEDGTDVTIEASTGLSISETTSTITLTNSAPDQTVTITGAGISMATGTYPTFTITSTEVDGSVTNELQTVDKFTLNGDSLELSLANDGVVDNTVDLSMYKELPASPSPGEMLYWDGAAWTIVAATVNEAATLQMIGGVPTWVGGTSVTDVLNPTTGAIWMDRNLGAIQVATSSSDYLAYGDLYQWGRASDGHRIIVWSSSTASDGTEQSYETAAQSSSDTPGHGKFIRGFVDWRSTQNDNLWQGVNGINNPCPSGYRIPTEAEWEAERASWVANNNSTGAFTSPLKLPVAGNRGNSDGSLGFAGSGGYYWSSTVSGTYSRRLSFSSGNAGMGTSLRAFGYSVRCLKD